MIHFSAEKLDALFDSDIISLDGSSSCCSLSNKEELREEEDYYSSSGPSSSQQQASYFHYVECNNSFKEQTISTKSHLRPITTGRRAAAVSSSPGKILDSAPFRSLKESFKDRHYSSLCGEHKSPNPQQKKRRITISPVLRKPTEKNKQRDPLAVRSSATPNKNIQFQVQKKRRKETTQETTATSNLFQKVQLSEIEKRHGTRLSVEVFQHLKITKLKESDLGCNRRHVSIGYTGLACAYCDGVCRGKGGRYFPSSLKTLCDSKKSLLSMYSHLVSNCKYCPTSVKKHLKSLYEVYDEDRKAQERGHQKKYYQAIWKFLRESENER